MTIVLTSEYSKYCVLHNVNDVKMLLHSRLTNFSEMLPQIGSVYGFAA